MTREARSEHNDLVAGADALVSVARLLHRDAMGVVSSWQIAVIAREASIALKSSTFVEDLFVVTPSLPPSWSRW